eukprot:CAMPEP_0177651450 /NCGR_PEP_ID=MMETSP0447-20121125/12554_1 /TAXON_ID=0 /ORGANISM="Stygamoeba regulata, Strain BSH-02190019" /LENGTH=685 /DNA_ID=CAMNT_0019154531 /DNA_START=43 /DNA_END=2103 /DNA_ORIENTATION=-
MDDVSITNFDPSAPARIGFSCLLFLQLRPGTEGHVVRQLTLERGCPSLSAALHENLTVWIFQIFPEQAPFITGNMGNACIDNVPPPTRSPPARFSVVSSTKQNIGTDVLFVAAAWPEAIIAVPLQDCVVSMRAFRANVAHFFTLMQIPPGDGSDIFEPTTTSTSMSTASDKSTKKEKEKKSKKSKQCNSLCAVFAGLLQRAPEPGGFLRLVKSIDTKQPSILQPTHKVNLFYGADFFFQLLGTDTILHVMEDFAVHEKKVILVADSDLLPDLNLFASWLFLHVIGDTYNNLCLLFTSPPMLNGPQAALPIGGPGQALLVMNKSVFPNFIDNRSVKECLILNCGADGMGGIAVYTLKRKSSGKAKLEKREYIASDGTFEPAPLGDLEVSTPLKVHLEKSVGKSGKSGKSSRKDDLFPYCSAVEDAMHDYYLRLMWAMLPETSDLYPTSRFARMVPGVVDIVTATRKKYQNNVLPNEIQGRLGELAKFMASVKGGDVEQMKDSVAAVDHSKASSSSDVPVCPGNTKDLIALWNKRAETSGAHQIKNILVTFDPTSGGPPKKKEKEEKKVTEKKFFDEMYLDLLIACDSQARSRKLSYADGEMPEEFSHLRGIDPECAMRDLLPGELYFDDVDMQVDVTPLLAHRLKQSFPDKAEDAAAVCVGVGVTSSTARPEELTMLPIGIRNSLC